MKRMFNYILVLNIFTPTTLGVVNCNVISNPDINSETENLDLNKVIRCKNL